MEPTKAGSTLLFSWVFVSCKTICLNRLQVPHQVQSDDAERLKCLLHFLLSSLSMGWPYKGVWGALMVQWCLSISWEVILDESWILEKCFESSTLEDMSIFLPMSSYIVFPHEDYLQIDVQQMLWESHFFFGTTTFGFFVSVAAQLTVVHHLQRCLHEVCMLAILPFAVLYFHLHGLRRVTDLSSGVCYIHHIGYVCIDLQ